MTRSTSDRSRPLLLWLHRDCHFDDVRTARDVHLLDDAAVGYAVVRIDYDQELGILDQLLAQEIAEQRLVDRLFIEKKSIVFVDGNRGAFGGSLPAGGRFGRLTGMPLYCDMDRVEIMKKTKRKKIVSIIGMISMRAFFMLRRWMRISVCPLAHATGARAMN